MMTGIGKRTICTSTTTIRTWNALGLLKSDVAGETAPTNNPTYTELALQPGLQAEKPVLFHLRNGMSFTVTCRSFGIFYCSMEITSKILAPKKLVLH